MNLNSKINVHGNLNSHIIFGFDEKECMHNGRLLPFTKTYRVALASTFPQTRLTFDGSLAWNHQRTVLIKFYGHSLGEADYSYFQALFDSINLYESNVKLIFYYKPNLESDFAIA